MVRLTFSRHAGHRCKVTLTDLEAQLDPALAIPFANVLGDTEQCPSQSLFDTKKCRRGQSVIGLSKPARERLHQIACKLRMGLKVRLKLGPAEKRYRTVRDGDHGGGARSTIDHRKFADDGVGPQQRDNALLSLLRRNDDFC
jgi:hypothetical protein